jgi:hypothetical protein
LTVAGAGPDLGIENLSDIAGRFGMGYEFME